MEDRRIRKSKTALKQAFVRLMKKKDISKITIKELCELADVNRSTFYSNYEDIYSILKDIHFGFFDNLSQAIGNRWYEFQTSQQWNSRENVLEIVRGFNENKDMFQLFLKNDKEKLFEKNMLEYHVEKFNMHREAEALQLAFIYHSVGSFAMVCTWIQSGCRMSCEELTDILWRTGLTFREQEFHI